MKIFAKPLEKFVPFDSVLGFAVIDLLSLIIVIILCFLAGFLSRSSVGRRAFDRIDSKLLAFIPGYAFVKSIAGTIKDDEREKILRPVFAKLDDQTLMGFEVERLENGLVAVFLPGSPGTNSGTVAYMTQDRIEHLNIDFMSASRILRTFGRGSEQIVGVSG